VIALAALATVPAAAPAAPFGPMARPAVAASGAEKPILVEQGNLRYDWPRRGWGGRGWGGGRGYWRGGGRYYGNGRYYGRGGYYRRGWRGDYWPGAGFALGLGLGIPLGYYGGGYYDRPPVYRPRYRGASAHVEWCYNRYRSYRAWDNTFQPYNGPRRQCYSPYS
jgi:hypothetical protein